ncbi:hypothetical protein [Nocardiopsis composta]|uniref:PH domain-containing protein n=1 Tax=Nocardiopsis composta TaxID=157465 RepID=A0A7W8QNQ1_9ACTN|nr:hypothetical protein [Nocardiopsis composta]MBB5433822.1 hypothetical protein [Nocardiopsis composta]
MSETVRLVCPSGRKHGEIWGGAALAVLGAVTIALSPTHWANLVLGLLLAAAGAALTWHGSRLHSPVLEFSDGEFRYVRGRYVVRIPFADIGSYYLLTGRTRSLGLCDLTGRPRAFPSTEGRRAARPYLPLTGLAPIGRIEMFMAAAGIPPRDRSITSGSADR